MTGEHRRCHLVPAGPHWISYSRLTWGGTRLCWGCTKECGTALGQDFQSGGASFLLHPFPSLSGYGWDYIIVPANRLRACASWCQGKEERRRRYLGVDNRANHPCGKGSVWDIILFCLTGAVSVLLHGFVHLLPWHPPPTSSSCHLPSRPLQPPLWPYFFYSVAKVAVGNQLSRVSTPLKWPFNWFSL